jgi:DNA-directed RNA polymerase alpha subunit
MNNPFETIDARLSKIETLLLDIKHDILGKQKVTYEKNSILIRDADFSKRVLHVLDRLNVFELNYSNSTLIDLSKLSKKHLLKQRGFGVNSLREIESVLKQYNLSLKP